MPHWRSTHQVDARVSLGTDNGITSSHQDIPTFRGNQMIEGKAVFHSKRPQSGLRYRVVVKGNVHTKTFDHTSSSMGSNANYETHTFLSSIVFDGSSNDTDADVEVPFAFMLQDRDVDVAQPYRTEGGTIVQQLLPSLDSKDSGRHWSDAFKSEATAQYQVTYTIIASAFLDRKAVCSTTRRFHYVPVALSPLPQVPIEDYPGEYVLRTAKTQQKTASSTRIGVISQEPPPLTLSSGARQASTTIDLLLMLVRSQSNFSTQPLPKKYSVKTQLRTTTFVMRDPAPPEKHTLENKSVNAPIIRQEKGTIQSHADAFAAWELHDSSDTDDDHNIHEEISTNSISLPLTIDIDSHTGPSFWSPSLSRRHTIELSVTLDDDPSSTTKLKLPVQIHYVS
ncbi:hypothetical protein Slin14017_G086460 [Septoria linicola]|nr:hypothetical protein Slin14017_G086460 [Septoria linicola]